MKLERNWTFETDLHYHKCPSCKKITESRALYHYKRGSYVAKIVCDRCFFSFEHKKEGLKTFGPLIGHPRPPMIEW